MVLEVQIADLLGRDHSVRPRMILLGQSSRDGLALQRFGCR